METNEPCVGLIKTYLGLISLKQCGSSLYIVIDKVIKLVSGRGRSVS